MKKKEIHSTEIWNEEKRNALSEFILSQAQQQTEERRIQNELLSIKFQIEDTLIRTFSKNI